LGFNNWITPLPHNQHVFLVSNFPNLAILVGTKMEKIVQIQEKIKNIEIGNFKEKSLLLIN
jgi:hypothetical protein